MSGRNMTAYERNPFAGADPDRAAIWDMLVYRDIDAYLAVDWEAVADDFLSDEFFGIDAGKSRNADRWKPLFSSLDAYREVWIAQARETREKAAPDTIRAALFALTTLTQIDIDGAFALAHKKFDGRVPKRDGSTERLQWQTHYYCKKVCGKTLPGGPSPDEQSPDEKNPDEQSPDKKAAAAWKIRGFTGYLPNPLHAPGDGSAWQAPNSAQHATAGPYSPVASVPADSRLIVISGQAPVDPQGQVVGDTIEEQTRHTLVNCETQLQAAGAVLADVFKVNVYLRDIEEWARFNRVYAAMMQQPFPARTAVQARLPVEGFRVEIEMWAARQ